MKSTLPALPLCFTLLLSGCQSSPELPPFPQRLQSWQGASFQELVQAWGLPARQSFETETGYAEWQNSQLKKGPTVSIGIGGFGEHVSGRVGTTIHGQPSEHRCIIQVKFDHQKTAVKLTNKGPQALCEPLVPVRY